MPTRTAEKSALAELEALERTRAGAQAESRAALERIEAYEQERIAAGLIRTAAPPELDSDWGEKRDRFHEADMAVRRFKVEHGTALIKDLVPERESVCGEVVETVELLRAKLAQLTAVEHDMLAGLARLGLSGIDMASDKRVQELAKALAPFEDLEVEPPYSRTLEGREGVVPPFQPNAEGTGWVR